MALIETILPPLSANEAPGNLIGRKAIVASILTAVEEGRSIALVGPSGIGKTAILSAVRGASRLTRIALYSRDTSTLKSALGGIAEELCAVSPPERPVRRSASLNVLRRFVQARLKPGRHIVLLDHAGFLSLRGADFFESLHSSDIPLVVALLSVDPAVTGKWWWTVVGFDRIVVPSLTLSQTRQLITYLLPRAEYDLPERDRFATRVMKLSSGNPALIVALARQARRPEYHQHGRTNFRLLALDVKLRHLSQRIAALE